MKSSLESPQVLDAIITRLIAELGYRYTGPLGIHGCLCSVSEWTPGASPAYFEEEAVLAHVVCSPPYPVVLSRLLS
jgi:hypothetical protein